MTMKGHKKSPRPWRSRGEVSQKANHENICIIPQEKLERKGVWT